MQHHFSHRFQICSKWGSYEPAKPLCWPLGLSSQWRRHWASFNESFMNDIEPWGRLVELGRIRQSSTKINFASMFAQHWPSLVWFGLVWPHAITLCQTTKARTSPLPCHRQKHKLTKSRHQRRGSGRPICCRYIAHSSGRMRWCWCRRVTMRVTRSRKYFGPATSKTGKKMIVSKSFYRPAARIISLQKKGIKASWSCIKSRANAW